MRAITLCADDFGMNDAVDAGILKLAHCRRINATSLLTLGPTFRDNAPALRAMPIGTGLHLDLTEFVTPAPLPLAHLVARAYSGRLDARWLRSTIRQQLDAFEAVMRRQPHHVDGHRHVHQLPGVRETLLRCLQERYPDSMPILRSTLRPKGVRMPVATRAKTMVIEALGAHQLLRLCRSQGVPTYGYFHGIYDFGRSAGAPGDRQQRLRARYTQALRRWLTDAQQGDLIMCHPADPASIRQDEDSDALQDAIAHDRMAEFAVLRSPEYKEWMTQAGVCLALSPPVK